MASTTRRRLLVITQYFRPEPNFITADVAESMCRHFDVTLVTAHPNYPRGHFYEGHRWWYPRRTRENGVTVWRLPMVPYHGRSQLLRAVSYLSFAALATVWAPLVCWRPAIVWVYQTPFTSGLAALWFKWTASARLIFTSADLWPESFVAAGVTRVGALIKLMLAYRRALNRAADAVICSTRGTLARYADDGVRPSALHFVPVWVEGIGDRLEAGSSDGRNHIVYAGNIGPAQSLDTIVRAAEQIEREGLPVVFDFFGAGSSESELRQLAGQLGLTTFTFHGRKEPREIFEISSRAFAQIVSLQPSPLFAMTIPSKVSFCCAAAAPVLYGLPGESATMLAESSGGIAFDPASPASFVAAVKELLGRPADERQRMRTALREYYDRHLAKPMLLARYDQIFLETIASPAAKREENAYTLDGRRAG